METAFSFVDGLVYTGVVGLLFVLFRKIRSLVLRLNINFSYSLLSRMDNDDIANELSFRIEWDSVRKIVSEGKKRNIFAGSIIVYSLEKSGGASAE